MKSNLAIALGAALLALASPTLAVDCTTIDGNLVTSCGFENAGEVAAWFPNGGTPSFAPGVGETGGAALGIAESFPGLWVFGLKSPCFAVLPGQEIALGYWVRLAQAGVAPECTAGWQQWSDATCTTAAGGAIGSIPVVPDTAGYLEVRDSHVPQPGTLGMQLDIDCRSTSDVFEVYVDNGYAYWYRPPTQEIPTLGIVGLVGLALLLGASAFLLLRRRPA